MNDDDQCPECGGSMNLQMRNMLAFDLFARSCGDCMTDELGNVIPEDDVQREALASECVSAANGFMRVLLRQQRMEHVRGAALFMPTPLKEVP